MPRVLTPTGVARLNDIPVQMRGDPDIRAAIDVMARETDYAQALLQSVTDGFFPARDNLGVYFNIWELEYGLSIAPVGLTTLQRQDRDLAVIQSRFQGASGLATEQAAATYLGSAFAYVEYLNNIINPGAETDTSSWSTAATALTNSGSTLTRDTTIFDPAALGAVGVASFKNVTTAATALQGMTYEFTGQTFKGGVAYRVALRARGAVGGELVRFSFGYDSTDIATTNVTLGTSFATYNVIWTPTADRVDGGGHAIRLAVSDQTAAITTWYTDNIIQPYQADTISIYLSFAHTDPRATGVEAYFRNLVPAHQALVFTYGDGFTIGVSLIGVDTL